ncbi:MAG: peptidase M14 [Maribacter sp.]|nr:peptidase M14 [Maribacter sp.]
MDFNLSDYHSIKQKRLKGRYITYEHISTILKGLPESFRVEQIGESVNGLPIKSVTFGKGQKKILMWSQMHGNESTTTKAVFDLINWVGAKNRLSSSILNNCTIKIIPILNPDGAKAYSRVNANEIDLNRDAQDRSQPESKILRYCFEEFIPDFCFNLHDQRTIFNVGKTFKPATISFLAPAHDHDRNISSTRKLSMRLIAAMNNVLQQELPGQVGRYDDSFNANCIGDTFQILGTPTVLFEAGHFPDDYEREITREYIFKALITALHTISSDSLGECGTDEYFQIPQNNKFFYDIIIHNAHIINSQKFKEGESIAILYKETLQDNRIHFEPVIERTGNLQGYFGHKTYDCNKESNLELIKMQSFWKDL